MANIEAIIKELKEYSDMEEQLKEQVEALKAQAIEYMVASGQDEVVTDSGKATYRTVISNRFNSTDFKKRFLDLYKAYTVPTAMKRFTLN